MRSLLLLTLLAPLCAQSADTVRYALLHSGRRVGSVDVVVARRDGGRTRVSAAIIRAGHTRRESVSLRGDRLARWWSGRERFLAPAAHDGPARPLLGGLLHAWLLATRPPEETLRMSLPALRQAVGAGSGRRLLPALVVPEGGALLLVTPGRRWRFATGGGYPGRVELSGDETWLRDETGPREAVADFLYGLAGDPDRLERSADWPALCLHVSVRAGEAAGRPLTPELIGRLTNAEAVAEFRARMLENATGLSPRVAAELISGLRAEIDGRRARVHQPGGAVYSLELGRDGWRIIGLEP